jgi:hypothetical protein
VVSFTSGTWLNPKTAKPCYFVPIVSAASNIGPIGIVQLVENADGSGSFTVENPSASE